MSAETETIFYGRDQLHDNLQSSLDDAAKLIGAQRQTISELREALQWISHHYANPDVGHRDFRIEAFDRASAALARTGASK